MPDATARTEGEVERISPYQQFVKDLEIHSETFGIDMEASIREEDLEKQSGLLKAQGQRYYGGMCQLVDDLIKKEGEKISKCKTIGEAVGILSGKKVELKTREAMVNVQKLLDPMIERIQSTPTIEGEYDPKEIITEKVIFAFTALAVENQRTVNLLPQGISPEENLKLQEALKSHKKHLGSETRPLKKDAGANWVR
ncbi:MAG: hypothetical protein ABIJ36_02360, partial [Patescibacteria group bacterium]